MEIKNYVRIVRTIMDSLKMPLNEAIQNEVVPIEHREAILKEFRKENENIQIRQASIVNNQDRGHEIWLPHVDRNE